MATPWIRRSIVGATSALIVGAVFANVLPRSEVAATPVRARPLLAGGIHMIKHVIVVMQENRSFDNYFGTFPGADGIPRHRGIPTPCIPDPQLGHCVRPFHDPHVIDAGGPHTLEAAEADIHGGRMDGFVQTSLAGRLRLCVRTPHEPRCAASSQRTRIPDVVGVPHSFRDPELLDVRASLRPAGSPVRGRALMEPSLASRPGFWVERSVF